MSDRSEWIALPKYSECFVCGHQNPIGLDVTFYYGDGRIQTRFIPGESHAGYRGIVHGGILATLLDECMGWSAIIARNVMCMAAEISVRYKQSAKVGQPLLISSELVADKKRLILAKGVVEDENGAVLCVGEGKFVPLSAEEQKHVVAYAGWGNALDRVVQQIQASGDDRGTG